MDIFSLFTLCGGLAFFLFGMNTMSGSLEKIAGGQLESVLKKMTSNPMKSLLLGAGITIAIQSSSAMTVMLVGLVNSGIMELGQTVGVIMGSNIGTTLTAWILSLAGIEGDNFFLRLLKPQSFAPLVALIGILLNMVSKSAKKKSVGTAMVGFAVLMYGMELMGDAVEPLADMPQFSSLLTAFRNPLLGVLVGAVVTGVIQSSAASVAILQALSLTGTITYGMAIPIIMGQNIGTCVTALLSSIGVNKNAKRVGVIHISFNLIGTIICLSLFYLADLFCHFEFVSESINPVNIAVIHSIFNITTTVILLPFSKQLERLASVIIREDREKEREGCVLLDERLLLSPGFAVKKCRDNVMAMAELAKLAVLSSMSLIRDYKDEQGSSVKTYEEELDQLEDALGTFLIKLSASEISTEESNEVSQMLHSITDLERMGDHALNIAESAEQINGKQLHFSQEARSELTTLEAALSEILSITVTAVENEDLELAESVEPLEEVIDDLTDEIRSRHIERLQAGTCSIELGFILSDLLSNYERISDHCSNLAACLIQTQHASFGTHNYLDEVKTGNQPNFVSAYQMYSQKYRLA